MRGWLAAPLACLVCCSSDARLPTAPVSPPAPTGQAAADLRLNAQKGGTFDCSGGLFFVPA